MYLSRAMLGLPAVSISSFLPGRQRRIPTAKPEERRDAQDGDRCPADGRTSNCRAIVRRLLPRKLHGCGLLCNPRRIGHAGMPSRRRFPANFMPTLVEDRSMTARQFGWKLEFPISQVFDTQGLKQFGNVAWIACGGTGRRDLRQGHKNYRFAHSYSQETRRKTAGICIRMSVLLYRQNKVELKLVFAGH
jgi:hypothetical protein